MAPIDEKCATIEQPPKLYKLQQLIAALLIIAGGITMFVVSSPAGGVEALGLVGAVIGLFWLIGVRFKFWRENR